MWRFDCTQWKWPMPLEMQICWLWKQLYIKQNPPQQLLLVMTQTYWCWYAYMLKHNHVLSTNNQDLSHGRHQSAGIYTNWKLTWDNILYIHAILGCDTTSKIQGSRKGPGIKLFKKNDEFQQAGLLFNKSPTEVTKKDVIRAGERTILCLYKADPDKTLEDARLHDFICQVARASTSVDPKDLPPTSDECKYHSMWVYLQVQQWKGNAMDPLQWGWEMDNINWRDVQIKNVVNNVDMSSLRAPWQNGPYKN